VRAFVKTFRINPNKSERVFKDVLYVLLWIKSVKFCIYYWNVRSFKDCLYIYYYE